MDLVFRTSAILAVAWMASLAMRQASAAARHHLWHLAVLAVLAAPIAAGLVPQLPIVPAGPAVSSHPLATPAGAVAAGAARAAASAAASAVTADLPGGGTVAPGPAVALTALAGAGTAGVLTFFGLSHLLAYRLWRRARPAPAPWQIEAYDLAARHAVRADVRVGIVDGLAGPLTLGLRRPRILLPATSTEWNDDRRHAVLHHEMAHVARGDCRVQALAQCACAVYWFNPLVWVAARALRRERERACDDVVLRGGAPPSAYAAHLLDIAREMGRRRVPAAVLAMARPTELEGRLLAVLSPDGARAPARATGLALAGGMALVTLVALGATTSAAPPISREAGEPALARHDRQSAEPATGLPAGAERTLAGSADPGAREKAAMALAASDDPAAIAPLVRALADPEPQVREKAALGLALRSGDTVIEPLLGALGDPNAQVREKAAFGLALRRDPRVVDALIDHASDPDAQVREKVAIALATSGDGRARAVLDRMSGDEDASVRTKAVGGLAILQAGDRAGLEEADRVRGDLRLMVDILARVLRGGPR